MIHEGISGDEASPSTHTHCLNENRGGDQKGRAEGPWGSLALIPLDRRLSQIHLFDKVLHRLTPTSSASSTLPPSLGP